MIAAPQDIREPLTQHEQPQTASSHVFSDLGKRLNGADTIRRVAEIALQAADELLGWDAASLDLWSAELETVTGVLSMDLVEGRRTEVPVAERASAASPMMRKVVAEGAQSLLREGAAQVAARAWHPLATRGGLRLPCCLCRCGGRAAFWAS